MSFLETLDILAELPDDASRNQFLEALQAHFDAEYYLEKYPDIREAGLDPLEHYLRWGWKENRDPSPDFSTRSYQDMYPDVAVSGDNPYLYYVWAKIEPVDFADDPALADAEPPEVAISEPVPEADADPVADVAPNPPEQPELAVQVSLDDAPVTAEPEPEPEPEPVPQPDPLSDQDDEDEALLAEMDRLRFAFDAEFYLRENPAVLESGSDPLEHFVIFGWKEGRDPSPEFSTSYYLSANPDVAETGSNPFFHYVVDGRREGRAGLPPVSEKAPEPTPESPAANAPESTVDEAMLAEMNRLRSMFDTAFYLSKNPGVAAAGLDPLEHFVRFGWKEGRDPHPEFSVSYYLASNPGVAATGRNPFLHYVANGLREGRAGKAKD